MLDQQTALGWLKAWRSMEYSAGAMRPVEVELGEDENQRPFLTFRSVLVEAMSGNGTETVYLDEDLIPEFREYLLTMLQEMDNLKPDFKQRLLDHIQQ